MVKIGGAHHVHEIDIDTGKIVKPRTVKVRDPKTEGYEAVTRLKAADDKMKEKIASLEANVQHLIAEKEMIVNDKNSTIQRLESIILEKAQIIQSLQDHPIIEYRYQPNLIGLALLDELIAHISGYKMTGKVGLIAKLQRIKEKL